MTGKVRLLPLVAFAALCLFVLKAAALLLSGGYVLTGTAPATAQDRPAAAAGEASTVSAEQTGDKAQEPKQDAAANAPAESAPKAKPKGTETAGSAPGSGKKTSEGAVQESLVKRRRALEQREKELGLRENLLKAAEKQVNERIAKLKAIEARIEKELGKQDKAREAEFMRLVKMYSSMKPKDAARIFDRLELKVLKTLVKRMKARSMSAILAAMNPAKAERLTLAIALAEKQATAAPAALPKIQSNPVR